MSILLLSLPDIVAQIRKLCREERTGTLLITNNFQLLGQISLKDGEITFLFAQGKRGIDALPLIAGIKDGSITFSEGKAPTPFKAKIPCTEDILDYLGSGDAPPTPVNDTEHEPVSLRPLSPSIRTVLEQTLKEFIGPIAGMVCSDHFRSIASLDTAIEALASEIPTPTKAQQFRELVRKRLG